MVVSTPTLTWESLAGAPLPSPRQEDWRFCDLRPLQSLAPQLWSGEDPFAGLVLPAGIQRLDPLAASAALDTALAQTRCAQHWPVLLNQASRPALLALQVSGDAGALVLDLDAASRTEVLAVQLLVQLEPGAQLALALRSRASGPGLTSLLSAALLAPQARLSLSLVAEGHPEALWLGHQVVCQAPGSELRLTAVGSGWGLQRFEPRVLQTQGEALTRLRGLQWVEDGQVADTHSLVRFEGPEGRLDQLHKTVADGSGRSVFNGAVQVPQAAQRTDASQLSRSLLLSDRARIDTKPELEIVADDVKCAHGATVSQLQSEELFYLQSRGIAEGQAARLLLRGYCQEVLQDLSAKAQVWCPLSRQLQEA